MEAGKTLTMSVLGVVVTPDGLCKRVWLRRTKDYQDSVEGHIELVPMPDTEPDVTAYVNEEGRLLGLHRNYMGEYLLRGLGYPVTEGHQCSLYGNVLVVGPLKPDGNHSSLDERIIMYMKNLVRCYSG